METLLLIGIGTGNPDHLTLQAIKALNSADLILIPQKGPAKEDLAELRREICDAALTRPVPVEAFDMPVRDASADYRHGVDAWHDAIAAAWSAAVARHPGASRVALLVWGDPSLYDSTLRIAGRLAPRPVIEVVPGITSIQALAAAHAIPLNRIGAPFTVTTGRRLRDQGWPEGADTLVVMLDGGCAFRTLEPAGVEIWWGAQVGLPSEVTLAGPLDETGPRIVAAREACRAAHGWVMDIYILRRAPGE